MIYYCSEATFSSFVSFSCPYVFTITLDIFFSLHFFPSVFSIWHNKRFRSLEVEEKVSGLLQGSGVSHSFIFPLFGRWKAQIYRAELDQLKKWGKRNKTTTVPVKRASALSCSITTATREHEEEKARAEKAKVWLLTFGQKAAKSLCRTEMGV